MPDIKLKPCPFCGGDAVLVADDGVRVMCHICRAQTEKRFAYCNDAANIYRVAFEAIDAWNRRADDGQG